ncbi:neurofilament triplet protein m [Cystoisospora suis]|uniref:Neurofilament triplet protein m n=1 Tax=Cystoisospora suis TaxID=483139 RepID=A0A2C6LA42_9APIC|nr:neurofilament triplet protein m [Cystoisospora suis]
MKNKKGLTTEEHMTRVEADPNALQTHSLDNLDPSKPVVVTAIEVTDDGEPKVFASTDPLTVEKLQTQTTLQLKTADKKSKTLAKAGLVRLNPMASKQKPTVKQPKGKKDPKEDGVQAKPSLAESEAARRKKMRELRGLLKAHKGWRFPGGLLGRKKASGDHMHDTFLTDAVKKAVDELASAGLWDPSGMDYSVVDLLEEDDDEEPGSKAPVVQLKNRGETRKGFESPPSTKAKSPTSAKAKGRPDQGEDLSENESVKGKGGPPSKPSSEAPPSDAKKPPAASKLASAFAKKGDQAKKVSTDEASKAKPKEPPKKRPTKKDAPGPAKKDAPGPAKKDAPGPAKKDAPGPAKKDAPGPVKKDAPGPVKKDAPGPVKKDAPGPAKKDAPGPAKKEGAESAKKNAAGPTEKAGKSQGGKAPDTAKAKGEAKAAAASPKKSAAFPPPKKGAAKAKA